MTPRHAHQCCGQPCTSRSGGASGLPGLGDVQPDPRGQVDVGVAHAGDVGEGRAQLSSVPG